MIFEKNHVNILENCVTFLIFAAVTLKYLYMEQKTVENVQKIWNVVKAIIGFIIGLVTGTGIDSFVN